MRSKLTLVPLVLSLASCATTSLVDEGIIKYPDKYIAVGCASEEFYPHEQAHEAPKVRERAKEEAIRKAYYMLFDRFKQEHDMTIPGIYNKFYDNLEIDSTRSPEKGVVCVEASLTKQ